MSEAARQQRSRLILCLAIVYLVWGSTYLAMRVGVQRLPPLMFGGIRFVIGGALLGAFVWRRGFITGARQDLRAILVMAVAGVAVANGLTAWSMQWVPSNQSALLNASNAFTIAVLGTFGPRAHALGGRSLAGLVIGLAGTVLLLWRSDGVATALLPQLQILLACLFWSASVFYLRNTPTHLPLVSFTALQMLVGGAAMTVFGLCIGEGARWIWSAAGATSLVYLIIMSACIAYPAFGWLTRHATPAQAGSYAYVNPAVATLLGWLVLHERLGELQIAGGLAILGGVLLVTWPATTSAAVMPPSRQNPR